MVGGHQPGMLRRLTTEQSAAGEDASVGDAGDEFGDTFGDGAPDRDVVLQEQRLGTADHEVVDHHRDQVDADRVVLVHRLGDGELGAHPVGRRRQQRLAVVIAQREQPGEPAQPTAHLGPGGLLG